jgi:hypothetical protein
VTLCDAYRFGSAVVQLYLIKRLVSPFFAGALRGKFCLIELQACFYSKPTIPLDSFLLLKVLLVYVEP